MALNRNDVESILIGRLGSLMTEVGQDGVSLNNTDLNDALGYAVRQIGGTVSDPGLVTNADVGTIADTDTDKLFDYAEFRQMESILTAARRLVSISVGPRSEQFGQIASGLGADIDRKRSYLEKEYGLGVTTLEGGVISLRFAETNDE